MPQSRQPLKHSDAQIEAIVSVPFYENTLVVRRGERADCLVVDPGLQPQLILDYLDKEKLEPAAILNTHGHSDHIAGNGKMKERWPDSPLVIGRGDAYKLTDPVGNLSAMHGLELISPESDQLVDEGDVYSAAGFELEVLEIPGHSIGHVVFVWKSETAPLVIGGDVLFQGSVGRTDFPDGDYHALVSGIREKLFALPDDTIVIPGHGPATTIGEEKRTNPVVGLHLG